MITSIVAAVVIFAILIVVHEAGHFAMAKRMGVRVLRFSVGYPPRLFGIRRGETDYSIGATPLGGYVRMLGDEVAEEPTSATLLSYIKEILLDLEGAARSTGWIVKGTPADQAIKAIADELAGPGAEAPRMGASGADPAAGGVTLAVPLPERAQLVIGRELKPEEVIILQAIEQAGSVERACEVLSEAKPQALIERFNARAFPSQPLAKRFAIVLAGPAANIIFAPILLSIVFMIGVPTILPVLGTIRPDLPGHAAGLQPGDRVVAVNGSAVSTWDELSALVRQSGGKPLDLTVQRPQGSGPATVHLTVTPKQVDEQTIYATKAPTWVIGVTPRGDEITRRETPIKAIHDGVVETGQMTATLLIGIGKIISGATPVRQALGGPIMIAQMAGREAHQGFADVAMFTVMLSLELGIINLFPVPLLDGGHLLFFTVEGLRGRPMNLRHREIAMQVGLFLLAILMAFVIVNDISRLIG